jgi:rhomboid family GlyGly-CTERM serine protease
LTQSTARGSIAFDQRLAAVVGAGLLLAATAQALEPSLWRYLRAAVAAGEIWRLLTAHFVHLGWTHLAMNALGWVLLAGLFGPRLPPLGWVGVTAASMVAIGLGLWLSPGIEWYVGLSGVLHGWLAAGAVASVVAGERRSGLAWAALLAGKLAFEQLAGPLPGSAEAAGGPVLVDVHLWGAAGGGLAALGYALRRR